MDDLDSEPPPTASDGPAAARQATQRQASTDTTGALAGPASAASPAHQSTVAAPQAPCDLSPPATGSTVGDPTLPATSHPPPTPPHGGAAGPASAASSASAATTHTADNTAGAHLLTKPQADTAEPCPSGVVARCDRRTALTARLVKREPAHSHPTTPTGPSPSTAHRETALQRANAALQQRCLDLTAAMAAAQARQGQLVQRLVRASQALTATSHQPTQGSPTPQRSSLSSSGPTVSGP